jgi:hypothetical protein
VPRGAVVCVALPALVALLWTTRGAWVLPGVLVAALSYMAWDGAAWLAHALRKVSRWCLAVAASAATAGLIVATRQLSGDKIQLARYATASVLVFLFWRAALWEVLPHRERRT